MRSPLSFCTHQKELTDMTRSGLYKNYHINFTEHSFSPENSVVLQIIHDITDINQSLTDTCRVGSPPILNTKGTTQKEKLS